jgi:hypothetical protein
MIWWFLILAASTIAVFWVGVTLYFRMRSRLREAEAKRHLHDAEHDHETDHAN